MVVGAAAIWTSLVAPRVAAMTPGSLLGVCYRDGRCVSIEGGDFAAIVDKIKAAGPLDAVRQINLRSLRAHVATADVLRAFPQLKTLELEYRDDPADLSALVGFAPLRELTVVHAPQRVLDTIAKLQQLEVLDLREGSFTKLADFGALTNLRRVDLNGAAVSSLVGLEKTKLTALELARTKVTNLKPVREMTSLRKLGINQTRVTDLAPLAGLTALEELNAAESAVKSLAALAALTALTTVDVNQTAVGDIKPLAQATKLRDLNLADTRVRSLTPLHGLRALAFLGVSKGAISATELAAFTKALPDCRINF